VFRFFFELHQRQPSAFFFSIVLTLFFIFFNIIYFKGYQQPEIFSGIDQPAPVKKLILEDHVKKQFTEKLSAHMAERKPYLNATITLSDLSDELSIPVRYLSLIINETYKKSFYDFINSYRIASFTERVMNSCHSRKTISELLYEVGFNSKASFNRAFKKQHGVTPSEYIRSISH
jgi:AraC-like DNA-binding protein